MKTELKTETKKRSNQELKSLFNNFLEDSPIKDIVKKIDLRGNKYSLYNHLFMDFQTIEKELKHIVKPFREWKKQGVYINQGERALKVYTPIFYTKQEAQRQNKKLLENNPNISENYFIKEGELKGFILTPVFDITQTSKNQEYQRALNEAREKAKQKDIFNYENIKNKLDLKKVKVYEFETKGTDCFKPLKNEINIYHKKPQTLLHEYGHFLSYEFINKKINGSYEWGEITAELFSFLYLNKLGQKEFNFNYSKIWASRIPNKDIKTFEKILNFLDKKIKNLFQEV